MTARPLQSLAALILAVSMALMGVAAAAARGQVYAEGQVLVLCSGQGVIQVTLDEDGRPTGKAHLCPDLAPGLMAAPGLAAPDVAAPERRVADRLVPVPAAAPRDRARPVPQARGPPIRP